MSVTTTEQDGITSEEYRDLFRNHPGGVAIITAETEDGPTGFTVTSVNSVSASPPVLIFTINAASRTWKSLQTAESAVVHFLEHSNRELAVKFSTPGINRFIDTEWSILPTGEPLLSGVQTWARGQVLRRIASGSSVIVELLIDTSSTSESHEPLVYHARSYHRLSENSAIS
jgi:flavin reductase (DIM6/NTAB) family NADH-FMN oxidoreductase RutF